MPGGGDFERGSSDYLKRKPPAVQMKGATYARSWEAGIRETAWQCVM
jgi:hypothetical protein